MASIFGLYLNLMRCRCEENRLMVVARSEQELLDFVARERAPEPYTDGPWHKVFKPGSPLEWFNPPENGCSTGIVPLPAREEHLEREGRIWDAEIGAKLLPIQTNFDERE